MRFTHAMIRKHLGITAQGTWWRLLKRASYRPVKKPNGQWKALTKMEATKVMSFWYAWKGDIEERKLKKALKVRTGAGPVIPEHVRGRGFAPEE